MDQLTASHDGRPDLRAALAAGVIGGVGMLVARSAMRSAGVDLRMNVTEIWGRMFKLEGAPRTAVGVGMHFAVSGAIAAAYAWSFERRGALDDGWPVALPEGMAHWMLGGMFLAMLPPMHPEVPEEIPAPGAFAANLGTPDAAGFLLGHAVFAAIVSAGYPILAGRQPS